MQIELRFFATFREVVGQKYLEREYDGPRTAGDVLRDLKAEFPDLDFFTEEGDLRPHLSIMRNGRDITFLEELDTELGDGDTLSIFPPVAGGSAKTTIKTFRGISPRAAYHYLERIGGTRSGEEHVTGDGWQARVSSEKIAIGPSLQLTEVTIEFEGDHSRLQDIVDAFSQKAMRAGG